MSDINDDVIAQIYTAYNEAPHSRQKSEIIISGVKQILLRLNMYLNNPEKFRERSRNALAELENYLNRFYYQDTEFCEQLMYEAKAYVLELGGNIEV
jgi:hypothetical protein